MKQHQLLGKTTTTFQVWAHRIHTNQHNYEAFQNLFGQTLQVPECIGGNNLQKIFLC